MTDQPLPRPQLLTAAELKAWLKVSPMWVKDRLADPRFVEQCVIDLAPKTSPRRTLRFNVEAIADWLGIPMPASHPPDAASAADAA